MQTLKLSVSLPDGSQQPNDWSIHPDIELRLSANDSSCDVVIALPSRPRAVVPATVDVAATNQEYDDYVLGSYAGI